ncbi:MAG TPA: OB-fold domain-containing protein [Candidatus Binatia bacterium]|nr:OB-fold domain-containing protein [Candidatus Binatia bacterium]
MAGWLAEEHTMPDHSKKPLPAADELSQPFWEAAKQHRLVVQRCQDCSYFNHPPRPACDACQSQQLQFEPVSGRGTIYSFTVMHQPNIAGFEDQIPYVNILVELEEQPLLFMVSNLSGSEKDKVRIGGRVEVHFEDVNDEITLPQFRLV